MKQQLFPALICLLAACNSSTSGGTSDTAVHVSTDTTAPADTAANTLSATEQSEGWQLLFDGKSLTGWHIYQHKTSNSWTVQDGTLHCAGSEKDKSDQRADLTSDSTWENFELATDWKIAPQGNSGIIYLASEKEKTAYLSGPEYQLIDDANFPEKLEDWQKTGANYAMGAPLVNATRPAGEWNHSRIVVDKGHVEHWLNGQKTADYQIGSSEWKKAKATGKWKDAPAYGETKKGHIDLQDHGSEIWFKNVKIKAL